jgi:RHS repeat-associated protein
VLQDLFYTYDPAGNITHIRDDAQDTIYFNNQVVLPTCDFIYDPLYRLTQATGREHIGQLAEPQTSWDDQFRTNLPHPGDGAAMRNYTERYFYDGVGNFDRLVHQANNGNWTRTYAYNEASLLESAKKSNRLSSTSVGAATDVYTHDAHGNMTAMPHLTLMEWDFRDQLSATSRQAVNPAPPPVSVAQTTFYVYDSRGERIRKVTESQAGARREERIYLGGFEIYRKFVGDGVTSDLVRETLHVMDDKQRVALVESRTKGNDGSPSQLIRYQFGNHLGSATLELDDRGAVISYEEYYAYGSTSYEAVDQSIKAMAKRYRYTGKERDEESGFSYHSARYYATWLGRWSSSDPSGLSDGINLYAYCHNSPMVFADHTGMDADTDSLKTGAAKTEGFKSTVDAAVKNYVNPSTGLTTTDFLTLINIESSGDPKASTGSHKGLFQLSKKDNYDSKEFAAARKSGFNKTAADRNFKWTKKGILDPTTNIRYGTFVVNERIRLANESIGRKAKVLAEQSEIATDKARLEAKQTTAQASLDALKDKQKHLKKGQSLTKTEKSQMKALRDELGTFSGKFSDIKTRETQNAADLQLETKLEPGNLLLKQFMKDHPAAAAYLLHQQGIAGLRSILSNPNGHISGNQRKNLTESAKSSVTTNQQFVDFWVKRFDLAKSFVKP